MLFQVGVDAEQDGGGGELEDRGQRKGDANVQWLGRQE